MLLLVMYSTCPCTVLVLTPVVKVSMQMGVYTVRRAIMQRHPQIALGVDEIMRKLHFSVLTGSFLTRAKNVLVIFS